ncbi:hypothetical protein OU5_P0465 (plasmid) [Pseudomonas mandelii JR-1]|uniref:Uncharacterized protein n=1 Tax=Pseudomonas mandelii JR-1 TaxID=1147786 RepID=A0A024ELU6_9PSED|nr:hypothetical protein OU5_P0465 [Pseudomonas mandelii JR-1]KRP82433.1 hypothetical protein TX25_29550 [Pseudomonas lactis]
MSGCNSQETIQYEGQISVFRSPFCSKILLADKAVIDRYGNLSWYALLPDDPRGLKAIDEYLKSGK